MVQKEKDSVGVKVLLEYIHTRTPQDGTAPNNTIFKNSQTIGFCWAWCPQGWESTEVYVGFNLCVSPIPKLSDNQTILELSLSRGYSSSVIGLSYSLP